MEESNKMNHCLICNEECKNNFGSSVHYEKIFKNQGLCCEHNFLHASEDKNNIENLNTIDAAEILSLLFLSDVSNTNFKTQFNRTYSDKIRTMLIDLSNIHTDLYFKFLSRIRQIIDYTYKRIRECQILNGGDFGAYQLKQYIKFLRLTRIMTYIMAMRDNNIIVEYLICRKEENDYCFTQEREKCDTCDIDFYTENVVMTVVDCNKKYIKRECVNCRKFSMNSDFIINEFNEKRKIIMNEYSNLINSGNLNIDVLIISYLFGENNGRILFMKNQA